MNILYSAARAPDTLNIIINKFKHRHHHYYLLYLSQGNEQGYLVVSIAPCNQAGKALPYLALLEVNFIMKHTNR